MSRRWRYPRAGRGKFFEPAWSAPVQVAVFVPPMLGARARRLVAVRRSLAWTPPAVAVLPSPVWAPEWAGRQGRRLAAIRRGRFWAAAYPVVPPPGPQDLVPAVLCSRRPRPPVRARRLLVSPPWPLVVLPQRVRLSSSVSPLVVLRGDAE